MDGKEQNRPGELRDLKTPLFSLRGVSKRFCSVTAVDILKKVDFDIYEGESVAVVGASGTGKSTFLNILGTLDFPDEGELLFRGSNILGMEADRLSSFRNKNIGFVFQFHHLLRGFTAMENVSLPCRIRKMSRKNSIAASQSILEKVGMGHRLHHRAEDLSGGEQQRVALARALVLKPDILLADEPTGNLDIKNSLQVHSLLAGLNRELGMTLMVVTHNIELAGMMDRKVTIKEYRVVDASIDVMGIKP
ncbi:MAG: ABC transporter ATP-binding protein [Desulfamplus sp.]|nr:ABC transporter ATP-binding protein [Desulfamplus sp.]